MRLPNSLDSELDFAYNNTEFTHTKMLIEDVREALNSLRAENTALKAELAAIKKTIQDKYQNANDVFGLNLGEEK
jgi:hypothetical protein